MWLFSQIVTEITQKPRQKVTAGVDFYWSRTSWTHNFFRVYELIFGRRCGIRPEVSSGYHDGFEWQIGHSLEAKINLFEQYIRMGFRFDFSKVKITVPYLLTSTGFPIPVSPYLFAIAFDTSASANTAGGGPYTLTNNCTGSNICLVALAAPNTTTSGVTAIKGSANTAMTKQGTEVTGLGAGISFWAILAPDTGVSSNVIFTCNAAGGANQRTASYSGVLQSGLPDSQAQATGSGTTITATTTVVASNCWLVGISWNDATGGVTAGANTTLRAHEVGDGRGIADSNATVGTGSQSLNFTDDTTGNTFFNVISIAPSGAAAAISRPLLLTLLGVT